MHIYVCVCVYICMCVCEYIYIHTHTYTQHRFIYSSVDEHLGCLHVLAIVNSAALNIGVRVSFRIMVFSGVNISKG